MMIALGVAFLAAYPVNRYLLGRGKGHALTHQYHHGGEAPTGSRKTGQDSSFPQQSQVRATPGGAPTSNEASEIKSHT